MSTTGLVASASAFLSPTAADDSVAFTVLGVPDGQGLFQFYYDGIPNLTPDNTGGALNLDLSALTHLEVTALAVNVTASAQFTLWTSAGAGNTLLLPLANGVTLFPLNTAGLAGLNLADIQQIRFTLSAVDLLEAPAISNIAAVPEPASGLLVAAGLVGLALRRRTSR